MFRGLHLVQEALLWLSPRLAVRSAGQAASAQGGQKVLWARPSAAAHAFAFLKMNGTPPAETRINPGCLPPTSGNSQRWLRCREKHMLSRRAEGISTFSSFFLFFRASLGSAYRRLRTRFHFPKKSRAEKEEDKKRRKRRNR